MYNLKNYNKYLSYNKKGNILSTDSFAKELVPYAIYILITQSSQDST